MILEKIEERLNLFCKYQEDVLNEFFPTYSLFGVKRNSFNGWLFDHKYYDLVDYEQYLPNDFSFKYYKFTEPFDTQIMFPYHLGDSESEFERLKRDREAMNYFPDHIGAAASVLAASKLIPRPMFKITDPNPIGIEELFNQVQRALGNDKRSDYK